MLDPILSPSSGLDRVLVQGRHGAEVDAPGVIISLRDNLALASVMVRNSKAEDLQRRINEKFGVVLPSTPRHVTNGPFSLAWAGPGRWLAAHANEAPSLFEKRLGAEFSGLASVTNQSDGRSIIRVGGPKARETLAKGVPLDLDPRAFSPGDTALTVAAHVNVHFWQIDAAPTYDFAVFRSFAAAFCRWLLASAAEFGAEIVG